METTQRRSRKSRIRKGRTNRLAGLRLLKMREVKEITGFSLSECYQRAQNREWETVRDGKSVRVPNVALARWIAAHTVPAQDQTAVVLEQAA